jgi:PAS domain S-box-containing protein
MGISPSGGPAPGARLRELEALATLVGDGVITLDASGNIVGWGNGAQTLTGYTAEEVYGRPVSMLYTEEDRVGGLAERELQLARETGRFTLEGWRVRKDGERFLASVTMAPIRDDAGEVTGFVKRTQGVTTLTADGSMFRALLEVVPDAMVVIGPDGRIVQVNAQVEQLFGFQREELIGQPIEIFVPQRLHHRHVGHRDGFFAAAQVRPMGVGLELSGVRRDGTEFPVEISLSPLRSDQGPLACAAIRDASARRDQEARLRRQSDEIMELSTPVIQVWDKVLALPIIGTLDSVRAARLTEALLEKIAELQSEVIILDISGVPTVDTLVAQHLFKTVQAATLMGAVSIISGVRPETAQAIVHLGIDLGPLRSRNTLRDALQLALQIIRERAGEATRSAVGVQV